MVLTTSSTKPSIGSLLPLDAVFDILLRLPVKTLCKFRCVSKSWSALISDPNFREHRRRSKQNPLLITKFSSISDTVHFYSFDNKGGLKLVNKISDPLRHVRDSYTVVVDFTRLELVCMYRDSGTQAAVCICNPSTGDTIVLPETTYKDLWLVAFGYVPSIGVYKVLRILLRNIDDDSNYDWGAEIFTLKCDNDRCRAIGDDWRAVSDPKYDFDCATVVDGAIYLLPEYRTESGYSSGISRFDLEREEWSVLPFPDAHYFIPKNPCHLMLVEMGGKLCLLDHPWESSENKLMDIWLLSDSDEGVWLKLYSINFSSFTGEYIYPLAIMEDGRVLINVEAKKVLLYDPKNKRFEDLEIEKKIGLEENENFTASFYIDSFLSFRK